MPQYIAATLLDGGRTAHSTFNIPLNLNRTDSPTCNLGKNSATLIIHFEFVFIIIFIFSTDMAKVLKITKLIAWDECTLAHKKCFEALDRTMRDFTGINKPMGNKLLLLTGDFRQILPVIPRSTPADELNACLKASYLWKYVKTIKLTTNMRVFLKRDSTAQQFSLQMLNIGNGKHPADIITNEMSFPPNFCQLATSIQDLITKVYPMIIHNFKNHDWLFERAILAPKNEDVNSLNHQILLSLPGEIVKYKSIDTVMDEDQAVNYPIEFLNSLEPSGMSPHILNLKIGAPLIIIRNLDPPKLCNGTRVVINMPDHHTHSLSLFS